jgi:glycosyltransferase involved in cell wall biosynthesis
MIDGHLAFTIRQNRHPSDGIAERVTRRFCFLTTFYPPFNFGGDGFAVQRMARALARRGHEVTVVHDADAFSVLSDEPAPEDAAADPFGVRVVTLRTPLPFVSTILTHQIGRPVVNGRRLRRILADGRFDVINFNNISLIGGPGLLAYGGDAVKVYLAHEHWLVCPTHVLWRHNRERCDARECLRCQIRHKRPPQLWRYTGLLLHHLSRVDVFIAMSEFSRQKHREFGFPHDMTVLPYFLPDSDERSRVALPRPYPRPYFLFVGRLERIKGLDEVIQLFASYPEADLLVAGDGDHRLELERLAAEMPNVRLMGWLPSNTLEAYYQHAIALLVPSICFETFGTTMIEAFSHGTPIVARRLGPFPEIIEQSGGGVLFDTTRDLLDAMRRLQANPLVRHELGRAAYQAFNARWCESAVIPRYLEVVEGARERRTALEAVAARVTLQPAKP